MRCFGDGPGREFYAEYHDREWGVPAHEDPVLLEYLILEGAQAGLSWELILKRREAYRDAFYRFDPEQVAAMTDTDLQPLLENRRLIRNRKKIWSVRQNAQVFVSVAQEYGSFDSYVWRFVGGRPVQNSWVRSDDVPCVSEASEALAADLKRRGMSFVGPKIVYSFMQAVGMVNDHLVSCFRHRICMELATGGRNVRS